MDFLKKELKIEDIFSKKINNKDLVLFFRQIAIMFSAKIEIVDIFKILLNQEYKNENLKKIIEDIYKRIISGETLSQSMSKYPKVFNKYLVSVIRSGEKTGKLDEVLNFLSDELESSYEVMNKLKGSLTYPIFLLITMFLVIVVVLVFVIPKMTEVLMQSNAELPFITKVLIGFSSFLQNNFLLILLLFIILGLFFYNYYKTDNGKLIFHKLILNIPIFGEVFKKMFIARVAKNLHVLIKSKVEIIESLSTTSEIIGNLVYENILKDVADSVKNGNKLSTSFSKHKKEISEMFYGMISVGEKTGKLDYVLEKISNFYIKELKNIIGSMTSLIEPVIMVSLGIVVALIVAAVLLPMYSLSSQL